MRVVLGAPSGNMARGPVWEGLVALLPVWEGLVALLPVWEGPGP